MKPCPFCNEQPQIQTVDEEYHQVYCHKHTATIYLESFREWNKRPIEDRLEAEIERLKVLNRWIPVTERLPESGQSVFVTCLTEEGRKYTGLAQYFGEKEKAVLEEDFIDDSCWGEAGTEYDEENDCFWVKEGWFEFSLDGERAYRLSDPVIFYMALPELPKEEE